MVVCCLLIFFFKQKTAYEMRISDWSSDVCSSDLSDHWWRSALFLRVRMSRSRQKARRRRALQCHRQIQRKRRCWIFGGATDSRARTSRYGQQQNSRRVHYRSEEHTSELQSLMRISYAVFCLKKKKTKYHNKQM